MPPTVRPAALAALLLFAAVPVAGRAQVLPDSIVVPDTILAEAGLLEEEPVIRNLPAVPHPVPAGWRTAVWEWDREALQATRAISLLELLEQVPGVIAVRGGDYGAPATVTSAGLGAGRVRVFMDGAEMAPLDGGVVDLSRVGLVGLDRVRMERRPGELRVELIGFRANDPRPYSFIEVGTGDLQTNLFRGMFAHPDALGGNVVLALDRIDTDGPLRDEPGASFGAHFRHTLLTDDDRTGLQWEFRRMTSQRPEELYQPGDVTRTDWSVRGRHELGSGIVADAFYHRSSLGVDEDDGGGDADTGITDAVRSQVGLRLVADRGAWWGEGEARAQQGPGWPGSVLALRGGVLLEGLGGLSAEVERQGWDEASGSVAHARAWTAPVWGISLYAEGEQGRRAAPRFVPPPPADGTDGGGDPVHPIFSGFRGFRAGAEVRRGDFHLGAALLSMDPGVALPTGLPFDRDGPITELGEGSGVEITGRIPLSPLLDGLSIDGHGRLLEDVEGWPYTPSRPWDARLRFHDVFLESENLEVWADVGVRDRNAMTVPIAESEDPEAPLQRAPRYQSWYARVQVRVVSVRIFVHWENFTFRDANQDIPGRVLPTTRAMYGIRWTLWN